jgi:hypothetical protein
MIALTAGHARLNATVKPYIKTNPITELVRKNIRQFLKRYILSFLIYAQNAMI